MANKELMITLGLESSTFTQKVKKAKDLNRELDKSFELLASSSEKFEDNLQGLGKKQDYLSKKLKVASDLTDTYAERLRECQEALEDSVADTAHYATQVEKLKKKQEDVANTLGKTSDEYKKITKELKDNVQLLDKSNKNWLAHDKRLQEAKIGYTETQIAIQKLGRESTLTSEKLSAMKADKGIKEMSEAISEAQRKFDNMKNSISGFDNSMEGLQKTQNHYNAQMKATTDLLNTQTVEIGKSKEILKDYDYALKNANDELEEWQELLNQTSESDSGFKEITREVDRLKYVLTDLNASAEFHQKRIESLESEYKAGEASLSKYAGTLDLTSKKMKEMNDKASFEPVSNSIKSLTNGTLDKLEKQLSDLEREFDEVTMGAKDFESTLAGLTLKQTQFGKMAIVAEKALGEYRQEIVTIKTETKKLTDEQEELSSEIKKQISLLGQLDGADWDKQAKSLEKLKKRYDEVNKSLAEQDKNLKKAEKSYDSSRKKVTELTNEFKTAEAQIKDFGRKKIFDNLDKSIDNTKNEIEKLDNAFRVTKSELSNFEKTQEGLSATTEMYGRKIRLLQDLLDKYQNTLRESKGEVHRLNGEQKLLSDSCDELRRKMALLDKSSPEYSKALGELTKLETQMKKVSDEADKFAKKNDKLQAEIDKTTAETNELTRANSNLAREFQANKLQTFGNNLKSLGGTLSNVGNSMMGMSFVVAGMGGAMVKTGVDFTNSMAKVGALSGETGEKLQQLTDKAREMGEETVFSATECADALGYLALAGYSADEAMGTLPAILQIAQAGGMDLATASDKATDSLASLGVASENAFKEMPSYLNRIAEASRNSNTSVEQLLDAYIKVGGQLDTMNISLDTSASMLGVLANRGIKAEYAGNSLNSILINMTKAGGESAKAMKELGISMFDSKGNVRDVESVMIDLSKALRGLSEQKQIQLINMIGGKTQAKTLQKLMQGMIDDTGNLSQEYKDLKSEISKAPERNTLLEMSEQMTDNLGGDLKKAVSAIQETFVAFFTEFEPQMREFVQGFTDGIKKITDKIKSMTPEQKDAVMSFAKWAIILPPILRMLGSTTSVLGSVTGGLGKLIKSCGDIKKVVDGGKGIKQASNALKGVSATSKIAGKGIGLLGKAFGAMGLASSGAVLGAVAGVGAIAVAGVAVSKELKKDVIPSVDLFADRVTYNYSQIADASGYMTTQYSTDVVKISDSTKEAVGAYMELDRDVKSSLFNIFTSSSVITDDIVLTMQSKFTTMGDTIRNGLTKNSEQTIGNLNELFATTEALSAEEKAKVLENENNFYEQKKTMVSEKENQIMEILKVANSTKEGLTKEHMDTITRLQNEMREIAINTLSEQEIEAEVILQRMKDNDTRITAEMCSENIKQLNSQRDEAIKTANDQYEKTVATANRAFKETKSITEEQKNSIIEEAKKQRDGVVEQAENTRLDALEKIRTMNKDLDDEVDTGTGKILSTWDKMKRWWSGWKPEKKKFEADVTQTQSVQTKTQQTYSLDVGDMGALNIPQAKVDMRNYKTSGSLYSGKSSESASYKKKPATNNNSTLEAIMQQNQLLMQLLTHTTIEVGVNVDGRQVAKSSARYMEEEITRLKNRKSRLGGN